MAKLIPVVLMLLGLAGGAGAGLWLRPAPETDAAVNAAADGADAPAPAAPASDQPPPGDTALHEFAGQFLVPLVEQDRVAAVVVMTLALEIAETAEDRVTAAEPRLRDALLQILFDHANGGGFAGMFTAQTKLSALRGKLLEGAQAVLDADTVHRVLITDILRSGA